MATLLKGTQTIVVPNKTADSYLEQGWSYPVDAAPSNPPSSPKKKSRRSSGVPSRTDSAPRPSTSSASTEQSSTDSPS